MGRAAGTRALSCDPDVRESDDEDGRLTQSQPQSARPRTLIPKPPPADLTLVFDGGALGNPGKGYGSYLINGLLETARPVRVEFDGRTTNNQAEYMTMLHGLRLILRELERDLREPSATSLNVLSDSKLVVEQVSGRWKIRNAELLPLVEDARGLLGRFGAWRLLWHPRTESVRLLGH
jgi:probable phosphoglycerate mutase